MAAALFDYGLSQSVEPKPEHVEEFQNFPGEGIHGKIDGKDIYVGNRKIALRAGCETGEWFHITQWKCASFMLVFIPRQYLK